MQIIIPFINESLGYSVIYETYRGNLAQAQKTAEVTLSKAQQLSDPAPIADALLVYGVVNLLQGELTAAQSCFKEISQIPSIDPGRLMRAVSYANLAVYYQYNRFPDGNGATAQEIEARWQAQAYVEAEAQRWQRLIGQVSDPELHLEGALVHNVLGNLQSGRSFLQTSRYNPTNMPADQLLNTALQSPLGFQQEAAARGAEPGLLAYLSLAAADLCGRGGNGQAGQQFLQQALTDYQHINDTAGQALCHMMWGDWLAAPFSSPLAWNFAIHESSSEGSNLNWVLEAAEFDLTGVDVTNARAAYDEASRLFQQGQAPRGQAAVELRYGYLAMLADDAPGAITHIEQARTMFQASGDNWGYHLATTHYLMARIEAGQWSELREIARDIGAWGERSGSFSFALGLGLLLNRFGRHCLIRQGDYEQALASYRLAESLFQALDCPSNVAQCVVDQGMTYQALGERTMALTFYEQALDQLEAILSGKFPIVANLHQRYTMLAYNVYQLYLQQLDPAGMAHSVARLTASSTPQSDPINILDKLTQLAGSIASGADWTNMATNSIADAALMQLTQQAIEQSRILIPLYQARQSRDEGNAAQANQSFAEALTQARQASVAASYLEAVVLAEQKQYDQAVAVYEQFLTRQGAFLDFTKALGTAEVLRQQERDYELAFTIMVRCKAFAKAKPYLEALEQLGGAQWWQRNDQPWLSLSDCAEMYEGLGHLDTALDTYDQAIAELERRRHQLSRDQLKTAMAGDKGVQYLYFMAARTALKQFKATQTQAAAERFITYAEQGKARGLLDLMAGSAAIAGTTSAENETLKRWHQINAQLTLQRGLLAQEHNQSQPDLDRIDHLSRQIDAEEESLRQIEAELSRANPNFYRALNPQARPMRLAEISAALPPDTALLQYFFVGQDLLAWAVTADGLRQPHHKELDVKALEREMRTFHDACFRRLSHQALGERLSARLLSPFSEILESCSNLIIVPYGLAHTLPFYVLPWQGRPLIESHTLSYLPSASMLQFLTSATQQGQRLDRILTIGNPTGMAYRSLLTGEVRSQRSLPHSATEARFIAGLFPKGKALVGDEATEEVVRAHLKQDYPVLHFATHGYLSESAPLLSSILLAKGEALSLYELMGMQLDADLVVLSACRTALGEVTGGDDVLGLTRGLLAAGAKAAVVSLWPVDDASTSLLMREFYRRLDDGRTPAEALRSAQNHLRALSADEIKDRTIQLKDAGFEDELAPVDNYSPPFYWASFVLVG